MENQKIPLTILTGFLGSGKTTVLNRFLRDPRLTDTAVVVNEFGEIGLDHLLVESAPDQMVLMDNGCLCCSVRGDLVDTLTDLLARAEAGEVPQFSRVMVETTGLADPAPIAQTLIREERLADRFALKAIVTAVDGVNGIETLESYDEARCQVAMADLLLVTKTDLAQARAKAVGQAARSLNGDAPLIEVADGQIDPEILLGASQRPPSAAPVEHSHDHSHPHGPDHGHDHSHGHSHGHRHSDHTWNIQSASIVLDTPLPWAVVSDWLDWLTAMRGADVLRIKGLLAIEGIDGPVLVQGVQHVFSPPRILAEWPDDDHRSRIVLIARDIPEAALRRSLDVFSARAAA